MWKFAALALAAVICSIASAQPCANCRNNPNQTCCSVNAIPACCPIPNAVCCYNGCCPSGYSCGDSTCIPDFEAGEVIAMTPQDAPEANVVCPGNTSQCPADNTCCQTATGTYGCCPLPKATCCSDHTHCCPNGYTCDVAAGTCTKGDESIAWVLKTHARPLKKLE